MKALVAMPGGRLDDILEPERLMPVAQTARVLSKICRWGGRGSAFYSVLQHSVELARALPDHLKLQGLVHDFSEAWIGDIPAPLKRLPEMGFLVEREEALQKRIFRAYGDFDELDPLVMEYDSRIALDEAIMLEISGDWVDRARLRPMNVAFRPLDSRAAFDDFVSYANEIGAFAGEPGFGRRPRGPRP